MRRLVALLAGVAAGVGLLTASGGGAATASPGTAEEAQIPLAFKVQGSHGYTISVSGFPVTPLAGFEHPMVTLIVRRGAASVFYTAHAKVTADSIDADLGPLGRVHLRLNRSGRRRQSKSSVRMPRKPTKPGPTKGSSNSAGTADIPERGRIVWRACLSSPSRRGSTVATETGPNRGVPASRERDSRVSPTQMAGSLNSRSTRTTPTGRRLFSASLTERLDGVRIHRDVAGIATASAFRYNGDLKSAVLSPPAPFSGSASLRYDKNSASPLFTGNLRLAFPGRTVESPDLMFTSASFTPISREAMARP